MTRVPTVVLAGALLAGCADLGPMYGADETPTPPDAGPTVPPDDGFDAGGTVPCDHSITVRADGPAVLVRDPAVLSHFTLERVLKQLITLSGAANATTPEALLQRMFDTENSAASATFADNTHCDSAGNGAFKNGAATNCPRAEGALAKSAGLLVPGDPDYFAPVALVNRFDLTPTTLETCGEYRIVFAKWSGRTDPNNRLFIIFEGSLPNPSSFDVMGCRPVQKAWAALEQETDPAKIAASLEAFYFNGLKGFTPVVHPDNFGLKSNDDSPYGATHGQVRVSQRMEDPWEMREFHLLKPAPDAGGPPIVFAPVTVKNSPVPELFAPSNQTQLAIGFRSMFVGSDAVLLAASDPAKIRMATQNFFNAGESALSGPASASFASQVMSGDSAQFMSNLTQVIANVQGCPPAEPLTAVDILNRASVQTCAGCHAPQNFLGPSRKIGCGLTWPSTLGEAHIDENSNLSPALTDAFLPHRADVMTTYLQACDLNAIQQNLQPVPLGGIPK